VRARARGVRREAIESGAARDRGLVSCRTSRLQTLVGARVTFVVVVFE